MVDQQEALERQRENIFIIFPWPKGHRGAYIINEFFPYFLLLL